MFYVAPLTIKFVFASKIFDTRSGENLYMRKILFLAFISAIFISNAFGQYSEANAKTSDAKPLVLLELFTSKSCFNCPPAERLLNQLESEQPFQQAELITLEYHVDHMDTFSRRDKYASPLFTQRQVVYERKFRTGKLFTPQMIVDGDIQFIGTKFDRAEKAIAKTLEKDRADIKLSVKDGRLYFDISNIPAQLGSTIYLAIAEDGITTRTSDDKSEKYPGNVSIVRRLSGLGRIEANQKSVGMDTNFQIQEDWKKENIKLILFIQDNANRNIYGVGRIPLKATSENHKS